MGFDFVNMTWDFSQDLEVKDVRRVAEKYIATAEKFSDEIVLLEHKINKLSILSQAMMELLDEHGLVNKVDLSNKINQLATMPPTELSKCHSCGSVKSRAAFKFKKCMYCGYQFSVEDELEDILK